MTTCPTSEDSFRVQITWKHWGSSIFLLILPWHQVAGALTIRGHLEAPSFNFDARGLWEKTNMVIILIEAGSDEPACEQRYAIEVWQIFY
jgi:hypothetical protein